MAFAKHHDPDVVDVDALSPWERELYEREHAPAGPPGGAAQDYAAPDGLATAEQVATAQATADAVLALLLSAQTRDGAPTDIAWADVLGGLVERGGAGPAELDGAKAWGLVDDEQHQVLLEQADALSQ